MSGGGSTPGPFEVMFDVSGYLGLPISVKQRYEAQWNTYNRIQIANSNVSTLKGGGDGRAAGLSYYQFQSYFERNEFLNGQFLHQKRYPGSNWAPVQED
jgi:hypothetical protein